MEKKGLGVREKILVIAIAGPVIVAIVLSVLRVKDIRQGAIEGVIEKSQAVIYMSEAVRENMSRKLQLNVVRPFNEIDPAHIMEAVPIVSALSTAAQKSKELGYIFRAPKFSPRNPENTPTEFEGRIINEIKENNLKEKVVVTKDNVYYFKPVILSKECLYCHGDPKGERDVVGGIKEGWKEGQIHGAFEIISSLAETNRKVTHAKLAVSGITLGILVVIVLAALYLIRKNVMEPLKMFQSIVQAVASGDMSKDIQFRTSDEFGVMGKALNNMRKQLGLMVLAIKEKTEQLTQSGQMLQDVSKIVENGTDETLGKSNSVAAAAEEMSVSMNSVAAAVEETSTNVASVAAATEEMIATIEEISAKTDAANKSTKDAVEKAGSASVKVDELGRAAREIGKVTEAINEISEQTNLLALNATIEAARAGEAGKGFAVVANEIKELARQTAQATMEIKERIDGIQASTTDTIKQIGQITDTVTDVNDIVSDISAAIDEQARTTREIGGNVSQASLGIQEVTTNVSETSLVSSEVAKDIAQVSSLAADMAKSSVSVKESSDQLNNISRELNEMMRHIKVS